MSDNEVVLTQEGLEKLQAELDDLKYVKRKELAARIKLAISYGDLKENSEYHSAKDDQAFMETRNPRARENASQRPHRGR